MAEPFLVTLYLAGGHVLERQFSDFRVKYGHEGRIAGVDFKAASSADAPMLRYIDPTSIVAIAANHALPEAGAEEK